MALHLLPDPAEILLFSKYIVFPIMSFFLSASANILQKADSIKSQTFMIYTSRKSKLWAGKNIAKFGFWAGGLRLHAAKYFFK